MPERQTLHPISPLTATRLGVAVSSAMLATALTVMVMPILEQNVFLLVLLAVLISSLMGGLWTGLVAGAISVIGLATFVFPPIGSILIGSAVQVARLAAFAIMSVVIAVLAQALISARHRSEQRAREAAIGEESFRELFNNIGDALYVFGPTGRVLNLNDAAARLHGLPRDELLGVSWESLATADGNDLDAIRDALERAFVGVPQAIEMSVRHSGGEVLPIETKITAARYFGRDVVLAVGRDLSERRRLEEQLRHSQKMDAIGRLAGGVAHDFNNLLTSIRGYASLMRDRVAHDSTLLEDLDEIERAVELATSVTGQLLAFSRKQDYRPRAMSLNESLDRMEGLLRRLIGEGIELVIEKDADLGHAQLDEGQIEQVVMNLAVNARDALPDGGRITIRTRNVEGISPAGSHVVISVGDDGIGMDAATRARIFEPFFTTKATGHGTGLGLSTVYGIVQQSGGHVDVETVPGEGTTFTVMFPRVDLLPGTGDGRGERRPLAVPVGEAGSNARTVLLAEDEAPVRNLVRRILTRRGYRVIEAANGREALDVARLHDGRIDALVTDVVMPELTGPQLAEQLRVEHPSLPVLFTSGYNEEGMQGTGVVSGLGIAFLQKPFAPDDLVRLLGDLLEEVDATV